MSNPTVNLPSRTLMKRLASCRVVLWALVTHRPRLVELFHGPLGRLLPEPFQAYLDEHVMKLREVLAAARDLLIVRERDLRDQKAETARYRRARDAAFKQLNPYVVGIRDTFKGACGPDVADDLGFARRTPFQPGDLFEQAENLVKRLSDSHQELPPVRFKGIALDPPALVEEMQPLVDQLGQALDAVGREEGKTDAMTIAKDEALTAYDLTFRWVARSAETLFLLASLPEIARKVRPSSRRPGLTDEVESQDPDTLSEDLDATDEDTTEAPAGESAEVPEASTETLMDVPFAE